MADKLRMLIQKRATIKSQLTRFRTYLEKWVDNPDEQQLVERLQKIKDTWNAFDEIQSQIEYFEEAKSDGGAALGGEQSTSSANERCLYEETYFELTAHAERHLATFRQASGQNIVQTTQPQPIVGIQNVKTNIQLPTINLPVFSGDYDAWLGFYDNFKSIVHENANLTPVQKLQYLRSSLKDEAAQVIQSLETSAPNYEVAWTLLRERYDNKRIIVQSHIRALFDLQTLSKESASNLRLLVDTALRHTRALHALGQPTDSWDTVLMHLITSKLDRNTHKEWERSLNGTEIPSITEFWNFLKNRCHVLESVTLETSSQPVKTQSRPTSSKNNTNPKPQQSLVTTQSKLECVLCREGHTIAHCEKFLKSNREAKTATVKSLGLCWNCLRPGHKINDCKSSGCRKCTRKHHTVLHIQHESNAQESSNANSVETKPSTSLQVRVSSQVILSTVSALISNATGQAVPCKILLDSASQSNFITDRLCASLKLPKTEVKVPVSGFGQNLTHLRHSVRASVASRDKRFETDLSFLVTSKISEVLPSESIQRHELSLPRNITLADPSFDTPSEIDALIGAELFYHLLCQGQIELKNTSVILQKTRFGWIVSGRIHDRRSIQKQTSCNLSVESLDKQVAKFWEIEELPHEKHFSVEERTCEERFLETFSRDTSGRYVVRLPFNERINELGDSYQTAKKRLYSLERRLAQDPDVREEYIKFMNDYESLGHMSEVVDSRAIQGGYFIPHHPVFKRDSKTTKLRVVFDASAKTSRNISLNEVLIPGPTLQEDLFSIISRFRIHRYVLSADIEKMYRQVRVHPEDADYQKILWREDPAQSVKTFQLNTVTYGTSPASFLAIRALQQLAIDEEEKFTLASKVIREDFYVDDLLTGASSFADAQRLRDELVELLSRGGFNLRKWCSNDPGLLEVLQDKSSDPHICLSHSQTQKTLGVHWNPREDILVHVARPFESQQRITKRNMLSQIASLFDPLGLLGPMIVKAKIMLQQLWQINLDWDESVPLHTVTVWTEYTRQIGMINGFGIPRQIIVEDATFIELHGFCDASESAYGAVFYVRSTNDMEVWDVRLVCSKTRVAPIKKLSLPRLELCAASLLASLYKTTLKSLRTNFNGLFYWSDSTITLHWIQTPPHRLKTFVANRVAQIQDDTRLGKWRHVPSLDNPADALSRGQLPAEFVNNPMWKDGPAWLARDESFWPPNLLPDVEIPEQRTTIALTTSTSGIELLARFSSFKKMKRVIGYCVRFIQKCRRQEFVSEELSAAELKNAENKIIRLIQQTSFKKDLSDLIEKHALDKKSPLLSLNPFVDDHGILRVGGRLKHAAIDFDQRHPALLPPNNHITELITRETHLDLCHAGSQSTLHAIRQNYWLVNGRNYVRGIIRKCVRCSRWSPSTPKYTMGNLPRTRLFSSRPFENVGVDFCGPFFIKEKAHRNRNKVKIYVSVFVCLVTKAVHLEITSDLTTEGFIASLKRLVARRGKPKIIQSDNATNFAGADNYLKDIAEFLEQAENKKRINRFLVDQGIEWSFIPPRSPHFGGIWEASVKGFKHHMRRTIGDSLFTYEQFSTFVTEIEAILNSRPLTPLSTDPNDPLVLTPAHFLINTSMQSVPDYDFSKIHSNRLSTWQHIQKLKQHFWERWNKEYLNELQQRTKWFKGEARNIKIGDLVLIKEDNTPPLRWVAGRVNNVHPGDDGIVRVASVKTPTGIYKRAIKKLSLLPIE